MKHKTLFAISGLMWLSIGAMLMFRGFSFLGVDLLLGLALFVGYLKGRFVLQKTAKKVIDRITTFSEPTSFSKIYSLKYLGLIAVMMGVSFALKMLPIPLEARGFISLAVGSALITGSFQYFGKAYL